MPRKNVCRFGREGCLRFALVSALSSEGLISLFHDRRAEAHFHEDLEYILVKKGRLGFEVNGERFLLREGEGIFVNSRALHFGYGIAGEECVFLCLLFPSYLLGNCPSVEEDEVRPYLRRDDALFLEKGSGVLEIVLRLWKEKETPSPNLLTYSSLLFALWAKTIPLFKEEKVERLSPSLALVKAALTFIKCHYQEDIVLTSFAQALAVSPSLLTKLFRHYIHDSPMDYLSSYRLSLAQKRLLSGDENVKTIALSSGYRSANFFARSFKKKYGLSPTAYRKGGLTKETKPLPRHC